MPGFWEELNKKTTDGAYEMNKDIRLANEMLAGLDIPYIDLLPAFTAHPDPKSLFYIYDGHFSPEGNKVVASCLRDFLLQNHLASLLKKEAI
jgi:hypothetical protein